MSSKQSRGIKKRVNKSLLELGQIRSVLIFFLRSSALLGRATRAANRGSPWREFKSGSSPILTAKRGSVRGRRTPQKRKRLIGPATLCGQDAQVVYRDCGLGLLGAKNAALKLKHLTQ